MAVSFLTSLRALVLCMAVRIEERERFLRVVTFEDRTELALPLNTVEGHLSTRNNMAETTKSP